MKYIAYCRKSTDEKDRQILSIASQIQEIQDFAQRQHLEVVEFCTEAKTAKVPGREVFEQVLKKVEKGEAQGIISWHPDRLARNSIDGGKIIYFLDTGKLLDLKFPSFWFENSPQGKFVLNIAFGQSKYYVDNLSENVRRGLKQLLRNGVWPAKPPYGYLYNKQAKRVETDLVRSKVVKQAFEMYANGQSQTNISSFLFTHGFSKKSGNDLSLNEVSHFLTNPFYSGKFKYNGEWYAGSHDLFISKSLFDQVQRLILQNRPNFTKRKFYFTKLIKCGECGASITAEHKTRFYHRTRGKVEYIYYRCTKKKGQCHQKYISEPVLDAQLRDVVANVNLPESWAGQWQQWLDRDEMTEKQQAEDRIVRLQEQVKTHNEKLNTLLNGYLDGTVESETYKQKKNQLFEEKVRFQEEIVKLQTQGSTWLGLVREFIETAKNGGKTARAKNNGEELANFARNIGSDYFLTDRQLRVRYKKGFRWLNLASSPQTLPAGGSATSLSERDREVESLSLPWEGSVRPFN